MGHWTRPHRLPKEHQNQKYKPLKEQEPVFHKMIYQNDAHVVMVNEADTLTDEMITDIVHHGFVGMRVKNLGAPAVACFVQGPPNSRQKAERQGILDYHRCSFLCQFWQ